MIYDSNTIPCFRCFPTRQAIFLPGCTRPEYINHLHISLALVHKGRAYSKEGE
jgi:hypothetical protein